MSYRRVLLIVELGADAAPAAAAIRRLAPEAERLVVVARAPGRDIALLSHDTPGDRDAAASLEALRAATAGLARGVELMLAEELGADALAVLAKDAGIDLVAAASLPANAIPLLAELRRRLTLPLLWIGGAPSAEGPMREIACAAFGARALGAVAAFLRDHGSADVRCTILGPRVPDARLSEALSVAGIAARVEFAAPGAARLASPDLLVLPRLPGALLAISSRRAPVLVLPPLAAPRPPRRTIDAADAVDLGGPLRVRITYATGVGRLEPIPNQEVAFVARGRMVARAGSRDGFAEVPADGAESLGLFRTADAAGAEPVSAVEQRIAVIRPGFRPLGLFDAELPDDDLARLARIGGIAGLDVLAVRLRPVRSCKSIRARLASFGVSQAVVDASAVLDEGAALDVPGEADPVRLARVAVRMRGAGFPVAAVVHGGLHTPRATGFAALRADEAAAAMPLSFVPPAATQALASRLDAVTGAPTIPGNRIEIELDNPTARGRLLDAFARAKRRIHFQVYMAQDDDVGAQVESALAAAATRGVTVRVVVDSVHGLHGSFGLTNPLLARLGARPNVELRLTRPVAGAPSIEDLKQRDHRKVVVVDGALALVGGRNLSHEYYAGFDEVELGPASLWREVPWLDAGARVEGPAVEALERSFLDAWTAAGGAPFDVAPQEPAGGAAVRVVVHHGLRDAATLETYLALIDAARRHVWAVNGFPLVLEIQRALLRAIARGVKVRAIVGHTTPTHEETPFRGPWSTARQAASELVDSRLDALVAAGADVYRLAVRERPGWAAGLGTVHPHVHAKVVSVDGRICSVGSANLDVTAAYWEDELLLVVEDEAVAGRLEARLEEIAGGSERIESDDPAWRESARRRTWMLRWPGMLSV
ncbi:MAG: phospholipase D-like domain-containing protein [Thermoanaerobaculia bacterium]